jgi:hypothetical protein
MGANGQLKAPTTLPPVLEPSVGRVGAKVGMEKHKNILFLLRIYDLLTFQLLDLSLHQLSYSGSKFSKAL